MKVALYIEDGLDQIVLTPQTEAERNILARLSEGNVEFSLRRGAFYANQAGYIRERDVNHFMAVRNESGDSTIIVMRPKAAENVASFPGGESVA